MREWSRNHTCRDPSPAALGKSWNEGEVAPSWNLTGLPCSPVLRLISSLREHWSANSWVRSGHTLLLCLRLHLSSYHKLNRQLPSWTAKPRNIYYLALHRKFANFCSRGWSDLNLFFWRSISQRFCTRGWNQETEAVCVFFVMLALTLDHCLSALFYYGLPNGAVVILY